jgi:hypothetical protein
MVMDFSFEELLRLLRSFLVEIRLGLLVWMGLFILSLFLI